MKKTIYFLVIVALCLLVTGCGTTAKFVYPANMKNLIQLDTMPVYKKEVAILPFNDFRGDENTSGTMALFSVPLFPYGYCTYDRPDAARWFVSIEEFQCNVTEDLPKALAVSLRRSNLFENAYFTFGGQKDEAAYNITGDVNVFFYKGRIFSYCLSDFGSIFWAFGAPMGTSLNKVEIKLQLRKKGSRDVLWEYSLRKENYYIQGLYYHFGWDVKLFTKLVEDGYNEAITNLQKQMRNNPKRFDIE
jgi:hypothetical protein